MKNIAKILLVKMILFNSLLFGAEDIKIKGKVFLVSGGVEEAIPGASVMWEGSSIGVVTDENGAFRLNRIEESHTLVASFVGFTTQSIVVENQKEVNFYLVEGVELDGVVVKGKSQGTHIDKMSMVQMEKITGAELCKAACCNLAESFVTNPSVDASYSDAATGASQIQMLGLKGTYVQMLTENMSNFNGLAQAYGLGYIPGPWMSSIQVSKGTSSVRNGYEAITGQINVEYKKPQNSELFYVNGYVGDAGRVESNVNGSVFVTDKLSTMILAHVSNNSKTFDKNKDGFLDLPFVRQYNFVNRWNYHNGNYTSQFGLKVLNEKRQGGQVDFIKNKPGAYGIDIGTERYEFFSKNGIVLNDLKEESIALQLSGIYHDHNSFYGKTLYDARQKSVFANLLYAIRTSPKGSLSTGLSLQYNGYNEVLKDSLWTKHERVFGAFAEYTWELTDKLTLLGGIRGDENSLYGFLVTPRLHVKYDVSDFFHFRASVGKGYRGVNIIAENTPLLASSRTLYIANDLDIEEAWNFGLNGICYIPIGERQMTLSAEYYRTVFQNQVVVDMDRDAHAIYFSNLEGESYSNSFQVEASYQLLKGLDVKAAYRMTDVKSSYHGELRKKPLVSDYKGLITTSYQTARQTWQLDFTTQFNGGGRLPDPDPVNPLWGKSFGAYTILNAQITRYFKRWSVYIGSENMTDFTMDAPIIDAANPWGDNFDSSIAWGPIHGRKIYGGFRFAIDRS